MNQKVYRTYTLESSFYWNSTLSKKRKAELTKWVRGLTEEEAWNLEDLLQDTRDYATDDTLPEDR